MFAKPHYVCGFRKCFVKVRLALVGSAEIKNEIVMEMAMCSVMLICLRVINLVSVRFLWWCLESMTHNAGSLKRTSARENKQAKLTRNVS